MEAPEELTIRGPMNRVGVDLCQWQGREYVVMTDYFSFFKWAQLLKKTDSQTVIDVIRGWWKQGWGYSVGLRDFIVHPETFK